MTATASRRTVETGGRIAAEMCFSTAIKKLEFHLAALASSRFQLKFCVEGTTEEHVLIDGLIENLDSDLIFFRWLPRPERWVSLEQHIGDKALSHILAIESTYKSTPDLLDNYSFETLRELVDEDPIWATIREEASFALDAMGFDIDEWERENVPAM